MPIKSLWIGAILLTLLIGGYLGYGLFAGTPSALLARSLFLPGSSTQGHYQIELACTACHKPFQGAPQEACVDCHGKALKQGKDVHAVNKFSDPRNAWMLEHVDALHCVSCHQEHKPELVRSMDVTLPDDHCFSCHSDIAKDRPSHKDFDPKGCASAGCHNYHDNKALYEDFLVAHLHEPDAKQPALLPQRNLSEQNITNERKKPLTENEQDAPASVQLASDQLKAWVSSAHAKGGINCSDCHQAKPTDGQPGPWKNQLDYKVCEDCHKHETKGFVEGKHGMRLSQGLSPIKPSMARLPMKEEAHDKSLSCTSCHDDHVFDTRHAAIESCLGCHNDNHSRAYKQSPHFRIWLDEADGKVEKGSGVSCATCHLPRDTDKKGGRTNVHVEHNQSMNLHPNEKMIRGVCMQCHGLGFSLDALSDDALIGNNFKGKPNKHVKSLDMAADRLRQNSEQKSIPNTPVP